MFWKVSLVAVVVVLSVGLQATERSKLDSLSRAIAKMGELIELREEYLSGLRTDLQEIGFAMSEAGSYGEDNRFGPDVLEFQQDISAAERAIKRFQGKLKELVSMRQQLTDPGTNSTQPESAPLAELPSLFTKIYAFGSK